MPEIITGKCAGQSQGGKIVGNLTSVALFEVSKEMNFCICFYWILMGSHLLMSERG